MNESREERYLFIDSKSNELSFVDTEVLEKWIQEVNEFIKTIESEKSQSENDDDLCYEDEKFTELLTKLEKMQSKKQRQTSWTKWRLHNQKENSDEYFSSSF